MTSVGFAVANSTVTANAGTGTFQTNVSQVGGTATAVNSGTVSNGTLRVTQATDVGVKVADASGNTIDSTTGVPTTSNRGLIGRVINFVYRNDKAATQQQAANGSLAGPSSDQYGRQYVTNNVGPQEGTLLYSAAFSSAGANSFGGAFGSGVRWYITAITYVHDNATASKLTLSDGTNTLDMAVFGAVGGSEQHTFPQPLRTAANGTFSCDLSNAGQCFIFISGYTSTI